MSASWQWYLNLPPWQPLGNALEDYASDATAPATTTRSVGGADPGMDASAVDVNSEESRVSQAEHEADADTNEHRGGVLH